MPNALYAGNLVRVSHDVIKMRGWEDVAFVPKLGRRPRCCVYSVWSMIPLRGGDDTASV